MKHCQKERKIEILRRTKRSMVTAMCGAEHKGIKISNDIMLIMGLNEKNRSVGHGKQCDLAW